jgi:hypothetical protein
MRELIALDSTFRENELEARALITLLTEKKPDVTIDEVFVRDLRARLIQPNKFPFRSPYHRVSWWAVHLAPIGVVAILLLVLMPQGFYYTEEQSVSTQEIGIDESIETQIPDNTSFTNDMTNAKMVPEPSGGGVKTMDSFSKMGEEGGAQLRQPDHFELAAQRPGVSIIIESVTLTRPGYIIIHTFGQQGIGPIVGVSPVQNGGTTVGVPIYLRNATRYGELYYAALYHDNGNGVFSFSDDIPVIDPLLGTPVGTRFTIGQ